MVGVVFLEIDVTVLVVMAAACTDVAEGTSVQVPAPGASLPFRNVPRHAVDTGLGLLVELGHGDVSFRVGW